MSATQLNLFTDYEEIPSRPTARVVYNTCTNCEQTFATSASQHRHCQACLICEYCGKHQPNAIRRFCNRSCSGKWTVSRRPDIAANLAKGYKDPKRAESIRRYMTGRVRHNMRGENHPKYNGYTSERHTEMGRVEYKTWRLAVLKRDNFTCVMCGKTGRLEAHHIRPWRDYRDDWYDSANGVALCISCHRLIRGHEEELAERFEEHVASSTPVFLSKDEREQFVPFVAECHWCGATVERIRSHQGKRFYFCNLDHKKAFEKSINHAWRTYDPSK